MSYYWYMYVKCDLGTLYEGIQSKGLVTRISSLNTGHKEPRVVDTTYTLRPNLSPLQPDTTSVWFRSRTECPSRLVPLGTSQWSLTLSHPETWSPGQQSTSTGTSPPNWNSLRRGSPCRVRGLYLWILGRGLTTPHTDWPNRPSPSNRPVVSLRRWCIRH